MRIALITEAWLPQVNGVVRTWRAMQRELEALGHDLRPFHPLLFCSMPMPRYPEIRVSILPGRSLARRLDWYAPQAIHIATEGPLGQAGRRYCLNRGLPFTTSYHTQFGAYLKMYFGVPQRLTLSWLRHFHGSGVCTLVPTASVQSELAGHGFEHLKVWGRGVDADLFQPATTPLPGRAPPTSDVAEIPGLGSLPRPIFLTAGRVAREKNIEAFADLDLPGSKVVVGDGPARAALKRRYPKVHWVGHLGDVELARCYAAADVFVFPSRTDTFGNVMLEANACGVPVAAYPVTGPINVVQAGVTGVLHDDLGRACLEALKLDRAACRAFALTRTWHERAVELLSHLAPIETVPSPASAIPIEAPTVGRVEKSVAT